MAQALAASNVDTTVAESGRQKFLALEQQQQQQSRWQGMRHERNPQGGTTTGRLSLYDAVPG